MTNAQIASIDRQLRVRDSYTLRSLNVPPEFHCLKIAERHGVDVKEVEARLRARSTP